MRPSIRARRSSWKRRPATNAGTVSLLESSTDYLTLEADVQSPSILLVTDTYAKGWRARPLAGTVQSLYRVLPADYCLRAIPLAVGHHHLRLEYRPAGFVIGKWVSIVSLVVFVGLLALWGRERMA